MIEWLYRLIVGHNHKWVIIERLNRGKNSRGHTCGMVRILKCEVCGKLHIVDIN